MTRVWVNGFEQISCLGVGASALTADPQPALDSRWHPWARVTPRFDFEAVMGGEVAEARQMDELARYTTACSSLLLGREAVMAAEARGDRTGVILGSAFGCTGSNHAFLETLVASGPRRTSPVVFRNTVSNAAAGRLAITFRILGSNSMFNSGMVSGAQALAYAHQQITSGRCDEILSGAVDWTSELVRRRFAAQGERYGQSTLPLMDGACIFLLGSRRCSRSSDWELAGYGMGLLDPSEREVTFLSVLRTTLETAGMNGREVDAFQLQSDIGALWLRSAPDSSLEEICTLQVRRLATFPFPENTAVPITLSLATSLWCLAGRGGTPLFAQAVPALSVRQTPNCFLFAAIGADGNCVLLLFKRATMNGKDA